jgi:aspartate aminotransferase-like enzyme
VTALHVPVGVSARDILRDLESRYGMRIALGQGSYKDTMIRIAHIGALTEGDALAITAALGAVLAARGLPVRATAGVEAALGALAEPKAEAVRA